MLQAAARLAAGQRPYRDFRLNYPPGQPLVLAALHKAIGSSLLGWRVMRLGVDATTSVLAYRLARRHASEELSLTAWLAAAGAMAFPSGAGPNPPAQALAFAALLAAPRAAAAGRDARGGHHRVPDRGGRRRDGRSGAGGAAGPASAGSGDRGSDLRCGARSIRGRGPREMFEDTLGFFEIQGMQRLPFRFHFRGRRRPSKLIEFYAPAISMAGLGAWLTAVGTQRRSHPRETLAVAPLAAVGAGYLLARTDEFHLVTLMATLPVMLATAAEHERRPLHRFALRTALWLIVAHGLDRKAGMALHPPRLARVPGRAGRGVNTSPWDAEALAQLIPAVHQLTSPGEAIFVANPRHDLVRVGNPLLYALLDRPNATRYDVMQPGVVTTEKVQREIVDALAGVRVIVRWLNPTACDPEPNGAGHSSGVEILDRYLAREFREHARYGDYAVLVRRGA